MGLEEKGIEASGCMQGGGARLRGRVKVVGLWDQHGFRDLSMRLLFYTGVGMSRVWNRRLHWPLLCLHLQGPREGVGVLGLYYLIIMCIFIN